MGTNLLTKSALLVALVLVVSIVAVACSDGRADKSVSAASFATEEMGFDSGSDGGFFGGEMAVAPGGPDFFDFPEMESAKTVTVERIVEVEGEVATQSTSGGSREPDDSSLPSVAVQDRIIVRTVDAGLVVKDIPAAIDAIEGIADSFGGWVINSSRGSHNFAFVSFRVPADQLDVAMDLVRDLAEEVESENTSSRDVTDQYVDLTARLRNQQATETALLGLLNRAETVEEALNVQKELSKVGEEIERLQGQIKLIEETSAFSLVNVSLRRAPGDMTVDAGEDIAGAVGEPMRFKASFMPPEDAEDFLVTWDFGDGSEPVRINRTAPTQDEGERVTATITHRYGDDEDSPYIAEVTIESVNNGRAELVEGSDIVEVTISQLPRIEVFAGQSQMVESGETVKLSGSFTRPSELTDVSFTWDFGDGSELVEGTLAAGVTAALAEHDYSDDRPAPYRATLTVIGQSEAGEVESQSIVMIQVVEAPGYTLGGWSAGDSWKTVVRTLSGIGQVLVTIAFWVGVLSPLWLVLIGAVIWRRRSNAPVI
jgi:hypothetical protein